MHVGVSHGRASAGNPGPFSVSVGFPFPTDLQPQCRQGLWPGNNRPAQLDLASVTWSPQGCPGPGPSECVCGGGARRGGRGGCRGRGEEVRGAGTQAPPNFSPSDVPTPSPRLSPGVSTSVLLRPSKKSVLSKAIWEP